MAIIGSFIIYLRSIIRLYMYKDVDQAVDLSRGNVKSRVHIFPEGMRG